jgi:hypothetical protein
MHPHKQQSKLPTARHPSDSSAGIAASTSARRIAAVKHEEMVALPSSSWSLVMPDVGCASSSASAPFQQPPVDSTLDPKTTPSSTVDQESKACNSADRDEIFQHLQTLRVCLLQQTQQQRRASPRS